MQRSTLASARWTNWIYINIKRIMSWSATSSWNISAEHLTHKCALVHVAEKLCVKCNDAKQWVWQPIRVEDTDRNTCDILTTAAATARECVARRRFHWSRAQATPFFLAKFSNCTNGRSFQLRRTRPNVLTWAIIRIKERSHLLWASNHSQHDVVMWWQAWCDWCRAYSYLRRIWSKPTQILMLVCCCCTPVVTHMFGNKWTWLVMLAH